MQGLRTAEHRGQRFDRGANDVVIGGLTGQAYPGCLAMRSQHQRCRIVRCEIRLHQLSPQVSGSAQLRHFHEQVHADAEEERQPRREIVNLHAC